MTTNTTTNITPYEGEITPEINALPVFSSDSEVAKAFVATVRRLTHDHSVHITLNGHTYEDSTGEFFMSTMNGGDGNTTVDIICLVDGILSLVEVPIHTNSY